MGGSEPIRVDVAISEQAAKLVLTGLITVADAAAFHRAALQCAGSKQVSVCMLGATRLDSSAVQILLALRRALGNDRLRLLDAIGQPKGALRLAGLDAESL